MGLEARVESAWRVREANFAPRIAFDYPLSTATISLTGPHCALNCAHCGGEYLKPMMPIWSAQVQGATSCLISGGCDLSGKVPVTRGLTKVEALRKGRVMNWHVGLIEREEVEAIAHCVDVISFDFVGDDETIQEVYGLDRRVEDYVETYDLLRGYFPVIPHITVGLKGGEIVGEYRALEILEGLGVEGLILIVFTPTSGTRYADREPPELKEVIDLIAEARLRFPTASLYLGCIRPRGEYRHLLDPWALRAGVNGIVSPASEALVLAEELGLEIMRHEECCAVGWIREEKHG
jgi:uncharacterized radical SAM superfamily protein